MSKLKKIISAVTAAALLCTAVAFRLPEKIAAAAAGEEPGIESPTDVSEPAEPVTEDSEPGEPVTEDSEPTEPVTEDSEPTEPVTENPEPSEPAEENPDNQIMTYAANEGHAGHRVCVGTTCSSCAHDVINDWEAIENYNDFLTKISNITNDDSKTTGHYYLASDITVDNSGTNSNSAIYIVSPQ